MDRDGKFFGGKKKQLLKVLEKGAGKKKEKKIEKGKKRMLIRGLGSDKLLTSGKFWP